jgi:hypothetical protein
VHHQPHGRPPSTERMNPRSMAQGDPQTRQRIDFSSSTSVQAHVARGSMACLIPPPTTWQPFQAAAPHSRPGVRPGRAAPGAAWPPRRLLAPDGPRTRQGSPAGSRHRGPGGGADGRPCGGRAGSASALAACPRAEAGDCAREPAPQPVPTSAQRVLSKSISGTTGHKSPGRGALASLRTLGPAPRSGVGTERISTTPTSVLTSF